ncbi:MAG: GH3 auxin-responsive promoter family protein [Candidatus Latescibacterota bacterium]|nr:GH3 auxin-responsive promoter family protein [Candidatus Latescibacterota bacterium]
MMNSIGLGRYSVFSWVVYPITVILCLVLFFLFKHYNLSLLFCSYVPVAVGAIIITMLESRTPHVEGWKANGSEIRNDLTFMIIIQMLLPIFLNFLVAVTMLRLLSAWGLSPENLWPHHWPIALQVIVLLLAADFLRYWIHRLAHTNSLLWKFHAVHHSPHKLYWVNVGRFHPVDKSLQFIGDSLPFILLGVSEDVLALYFVFYAVNGFFQHSNVEMRFGLLNYVISSAELHRWHHSSKPLEANQNYGNNIIIWDILFGTYFLPKNRHVTELGLYNRTYPQDFTSQMKAPFSGNIDKHAAPLNNFRSFVLNTLLGFRMSIIGWTLYSPLKRAAMNVKETQWKVLESILDRNKDTEFGLRHDFKDIVDLRNFRDKLPVVEYESLREDIERQGGEKIRVLTSEHPVMYNQTSGTTGQPKYIPVLSRTLEHLRRSQKIFSYVQYSDCKEAFSGRIVGMVSPAIDGTLANGVPFGSASGHIYKTMPKVAKAKYLLPEEVFGIEDYGLKYQVIARLCFEADDITYLGSANPSSFHRLLEVVNAHRFDMVSDIEDGVFRRIDELPENVAAAVKRCLRPNSERANILGNLLAAGNPINYADFWPCLKLVATWTGGSCGVSLSGILASFPSEVRISELGYLSSEFRGTITIDAETNAGVPTIQECFFEFVEQSAWEDHHGPFLGIEEIELNKRYYVFVTTPSGLYRYNMNDIIEVSGKFWSCPTIRFLQKGRGVTNITGEKIYESQIIQTMDNAFKKFGFSCRFYQVIAYQEKSQYVIFLELNLESDMDEEAFAAYVDEKLCSFNIEYKEKRMGERLLPAKVILLKTGSYEGYKEYCLSKGQSESQFKGALLQYDTDHDFDWSPWLVSESSRGN